MSQMSFGEPEVAAPAPDTTKSGQPTKRVELMATMLLGFIAPGFESWSKAPLPLRHAALQAAEKALAEVQARKDELEGRTSG